MGAREVLELIVKATTRTAQRAMTGMKNQFTRFKDSIANGQQALQNFVGGLGELRVGVSLINGLIEPAMTLEQALFTTQETFKSMSDTVISRSKTMAEESIFTQAEILTAYNKLNDSMTRYGLTAKQQHEIVVTSMDTAAAKGLDLMEAASRVESAMRGEAEASEYLGLTLSDTYFTTIYLNGELADTWETLDEATKAQHRFNAMMLQSSKYQGANARAMEENIGKMKDFEAQQEEVRQAMGQTLFPILIPMIGRLQELAIAYEKLPPAIKIAVPAIILLTGAVMTLGAAMLFLTASSAEWLAIAAGLIVFFALVQSEAGTLRAIITTLTVAISGLAIALWGASATPIVVVLYSIIMAVIILEPWIRKLTKALFGSGLHQALIEVGNAAILLLSPFAMIITHLKDMIRYAKQAGEAMNKVPGVGAVTSAIGKVSGLMHFQAGTDQYGGTVPGPVGKPMPAIVHGGETITPVGEESKKPNLTIIVQGPKEYEREIVKITQRQFQRGAYAR